MRVDTVCSWGSCPGSRQATMRLPRAALFQGPSNSNHTTRSASPFPHWTMYRGILMRRRGEIGPRDATAGCAEKRLQLEMKEKKKQGILRGYMGWDETGPCAV